MRSGVTLATLREELAIEAGISTEPAHLAAEQPRLDQLLRRTERIMARMDDWGSLSFEEEVTVSADAQFASLPSNIAFTDIRDCWVAFGSQWLPVAHGIGSVERSIYNTSQRATPITRWEIQAPGNVNFEVWPIGASAQTLRFTGQKALGTFTDDTDTCTLDADVIVLRAAAQMLARDRKEDAALLLDQARLLTERILKAQGSTKSPEIDLARRPTRALRPGIDYIPPEA